MRMIRSWWMNNSRWCEVLNTAIATRHQDTNFASWCLSGWETTARLAEDSKPRSPNSGSLRFVPLLHQLLLSITGASSAAFVLFVNLYRGVVSTPLHSSSSNYLWYWYLFLRAGVRLSSVFGQG